jgi:IclR family KDG regulon transcriptional repressor
MTAKADQLSNRTVDRALEILDLVASNNKEGLIFSDISRELKIPKSSLSSILVSLVNNSFLAYNAKEKSYFLGEAMFNLGNRFVDNLNMLASIEKVLARTVQETGYTSFFAVLSGNETRYLLRKVSSSQTFTPASPQYALKASCTGVGKAMLLDKTKEELDALFVSGMPKVTPNTITSTEELYEQLSACKARDIVFEKEESSLNIQCRATPIRYNGKILAAVSISFPIWVTDADEISKIEQALVEEATAIERIIGQAPNKWVYSNIH